MSDLIDPPPLTADQPIPGAATYDCCRHCDDTWLQGGCDAPRDGHNTPCPDGCNWGQGVPA